MDALFAKVIHLPLRGIKAKEGVDDEKMQFLFKNNQDIRVHSQLLSASIRDVLCQTRNSKAGYGDILDTSSKGCCQRSVFPDENLSNLMPDL